MTSRTYHGLQERLDALQREIEAAGYQIRTIWLDEYGGPQSVVMGLSDRLIIEKRCDIRI